MWDSVKRQFKQNYKFCGNYPSSYFDSLQFSSWLLTLGLNSAKVKKTEIHECKKQNLDTIHKNNKIQKQQNQQKYGNRTNKTKPAGINKYNTKQKQPKINNNMEIEQINHE
jgi:hypothetical protein